MTLDSHETLVFHQLERSNMTDRERIDAALLTAVDNIVTTECCSSCSAAAAPDGTYAFYHAQDIERSFARPEDGATPIGEFLDGAPLSEYDEATTLVGDMYIGFGIAEPVDAMPRLDEEYDAIGEQIVRALRDAGVLVQWTGSANQKVHIVGITDERVFA